MRTFDKFTYTLLGAFGLFVFGFFCCVVVAGTVGWG